MDAMTEPSPHRRLIDRTCRADLQPLGSLDLLDLDSLACLFGADFLPYPFMHTLPSPFITADDAARHASLVRERSTTGDLRLFTEYMKEFATADIRVTFHVQHMPNDTPSVRVMAHRKGPAGYFTEQWADADAVDVYQLSPFDLGAAICEASPLTQPGRYRQIIVPEYAPRRPDFDSEDFFVGDSRDSPPEVRIPAYEVSAYATVQSRWRRGGKWGPDRSKAALVWIHVVDDGDYIYERDMSVASPMTPRSLHDRIDQLIADDVAIVRRLRGG